MEPAQPSDSLIGIANLVYGLHALSIALGVFTIWTIVGAFVFSVPSLVAVVVNYMNQDKARGTWLESHFRWQIRTFWYALLLFFVAGMFFVTIIGIPIAWVVLAGAGIWVIYRIVHGWMKLADRKAVDVVTLEA
jgi:uncharacterized membrane protein